MQTFLTIWAVVLLVAAVMAATAAMGFAARVAWLRTVRLQPEPWTPFFYWGTVYFVLALAAYTVAKLAETSGS